MRPRPGGVRRRAEQVPARRAETRTEVGLVLLAALDRSLREHESREGRTGDVVDDHRTAHPAPEASTDLAISLPSVAQVGIVRGDDHGLDRLGESTARDDHGRDGVRRLVDHDQQRVRLRFLGGPLAHERDKLMDGDQRRVAEALDAAKRLTLSTARRRILTARAYEEAGRPACLEDLAHEGQAGAERLALCVHC